jgi:hypothetical protein
MQGTVAAIKIRLEIPKNIKIGCVHSNTNKYFLKFSVRIWFPR